MANSPDRTLNSKKIAGVILYPLKDKIRFKVKGKIFDSEKNDFVENSQTLESSDSIWNLVFGGARGTKRFLKVNKVVIKELSLSVLGYENCEIRG